MVCKELSDKGKEGWNMGAMRGSEGDNNFDGWRQAIISIIVYLALANKFTLSVSKRRMTQEEYFMLIFKTKI